MDKQADHLLMGGYGKGIRGLDFTPLIAVTNKDLVVYG